MLNWKKCLKSSEKSCQPMCNAVKTMFWLEMVLFVSNQRVQLKQPYIPWIKSRWKMARSWLFHNMFINALSKQMAKLQAASSKKSCRRLTNLIYLSKIFPTAWPKMKLRSYLNSVARLSPWKNVKERIIFQEAAQHMCNTLFFLLTLIMLRQQLKNSTNHLPLVQDP